MDYDDYYEYTEYNTEWHLGYHTNRDGITIELNNLDDNYLDNLILFGKKKGFITYHLELEKRIRILSLNNK